MIQKKQEPWYIHAALWVVIIVLSYVLIEVAIVQPREIMRKERYFKKESRIRMDDIRQAEILWHNKKGYFTDNLDSLIEFIKTDSTVIKAMTGFDTITKKSTNPFKSLVSTGEFVPESLLHSPKSLRPYLLQIDSSTEYDTTVNRWGKLVKIDTVKTFGHRYYLEDKDGYGTIGDLYNNASLNTASWE
jgi:hypothetical protein